MVVVVVVVVVVAVVMVVVVVVVIRKNFIKFSRLEMLTFQHAEHAGMHLKTLSSTDCQN